MSDTYKFQRNLIISIHSRLFFSNCERFQCNLNCQILTKLNPNLFSIWQFKLRVWNNIRKNEFKLRQKTFNLYFWVGDQMMNFCGQLYYIFITLIGMIQFKSPPVQLRETKFYCRYWLRGNSYSYLNANNIFLNSWFMKQYFALLTIAYRFKENANQRKFSTKTMININKVFFFHFIAKKSHINLCLFIRKCKCKFRLRQKTLN